jgi:hypothetical protein
MNKSKDRFMGMPKNPETLVCMYQPDSEHGQFLISQDTVDDPEIDFRCKKCMEVYDDEE